MEYLLSFIAGATVCYIVCWIVKPEEKTRMNAYVIRINDVNCGEEYAVTGESPRQAMDFARNYYLGISEYSTGTITEYNLNTPQALMSRKWYKSDIGKE